MGLASRFSSWNFHQNWTDKQGFFIRSLMLEPVKGFGRGMQFRLTQQRLDKIRLLIAKLRVAPGSILPLDEVFQREAENQQRQKRAAARAKAPFTLLMGFGMDGGYPLHELHMTSMLRAADADLKPPAPPDVPWAVLGPRLITTT